jgi:hypothetical protein
VGLDHIGLGVKTHVPHLLEELDPGHHLIGMKQEIFGQPEFARGELDRAAASTHLPLQAIHLQVLEPKLSTDPSGASPGQGIHASHQLVEVERLGQIVVRAGIEAPDHVGGRVAPGEHQNGSLHPFAAELGGKLKTVLFGELDVEDDQVVGIQVAQKGPGLAVLGDFHGVTLFLKPLLEKSGRPGVVLDYENPHQCPPVQCRQG